MAFFRLICYLHHQQLHVQLKSQDGSSQDPEEALDTICHGGVNVMVWVCFGGGKEGDLYKIKGILNVGYHYVLQSHACE